MSEQEKIFSNKGLIIIGIISALIFVVGIILLALGYNEAFYVDNAVVQAIFGVITLTGDAVVYLIIIAIFYIVYDKKFTKNLLFSLLFSTYLNNFLKETFQDPRPPSNVDPTSETGYIETSYGFPSGHSQSAVAVYGYIGYGFKDKAKYYVIPTLLSVWIFLVALSRIILGVHDLQDIIGGLLIGIGFLLAFIYLEPIISEKINTLSLQLKIIIAVVVSILLLIIAILLFPTSGQGLVKNPVPYADTGGFAQVMGALLGFSVGYLLENEYVNYQPSELNKKWKIINLILGLILLLGLYVILGFLLRGNVVLRFIRYAVLSFTISLLAPWIFTKINRK